MMLILGLVLMAPVLFFAFALFASLFDALLDYFPGFVYGVIFPVAFLIGAAMVFGP